MIRRIRVESVGAELKESISETFQREKSLRLATKLSTGTKEPGGSQTQVWKDNRDLGTLGWGAGGDLLPTSVGQKVLRDVGALFPPLPELSFLVCVFLLLLELQPFQDQGNEGQKKKNRA